jgi:SAM-dependent methyltransferase
MGRWSRLVAPEFVRFTGLPASGSILDAGSGTGSLAFAIGQRSNKLRIVGIDPSEEYVRYAAGKNPFPDRVRFEVGDAQRLPFEEGSFDGAVSLLVFNFIPDPKKALSELRRVTKPLSKISAAVWDYSAGMRMLRLFWDAAIDIDPQAEKADEKHMPLCRAGELVALWKDGGLGEVRGQPINITMRFENFADYWEPFLLGQGPAGSYARRLNEGKLEALRSQIRKRLHHRAEDAPLVLSARVWAVRGTVPSHRRR